jgi:molecular chaperone GrpE (heat shock protein)
LFIFDGLDQPAAKVLAGADDEVRIKGLIRGSPMITPAKLDVRSTSSADANGGSGVPGDIQQRSTTPASNDSSGSKLQSNPAVEALLKLIEQLEKQLQREQQELKTATAQSNPDNPATLARVTAAQSGVATTLGQLQSAMQKLAEALTQMGDSSSGTLLNTSA